MSQGEKILNLLAIFHYIVGAMTALFACLPMIHVAFGVAMVIGKLDGKDAPPPFIGWIFIIFGAVFITAGWILATFVIIAGRKLRRQKNRTFCLVVAGIECMMIPFGTVLGVFTIVVLMQDSVKQFFEPAKPENQMA